MPPSDATLNLEDGERNGASEEVSPGQQREILKSPNGADEGARLITLQLGRAAVVVPPPDSDIVIRAKVTWGVAKTSTSAMLDWRHGTVVTLAATSFTVVAIYENNGKGPKVRCAVMAAYEARPGFAPTWTDRVGKVESGSRSDLFPVPDWATHLTLLSTAPAFMSLEKVEVWLLDAAGNTRVVALPTRTTDDEAVPVPEGIEYALVFNNGDTAEFTLRWLLCL